jgi:hypothetical protein
MAVPVDTAPVIVTDVGVSVLCPQPRRFMPLRQRCNSHRQRVERPAPLRTVPSIRDIGETTDGIGTYPGIAVRNPPDSRPPWASWEYHLHHLGMAALRWGPAEASSQDRVPARSAGWLIRPHSFGVESRSHAGPRDSALSTDPISCRAYRGAVTHSPTPDRVCCRPSVCPAASLDPPGEGADSGRTSLLASAMVYVPTTTAKR